ncbi:hypothetical protein [Ureibacillus terrenus]|uniref:hypothetical protein n=1 Tax=Ureibacillus terrenus TaxID=118246 RepID=UPI002E1BD9C5|nr:hypothetical protein [Ureibacillus terrenus]
MNCKQCGIVLNSHMNYCPNCGYKVERIVDGSDDNKNDLVQTSYMDNNKKEVPKQENTISTNNSEGGWLGCLGCLGLIIILVIMIASCVNSNSDDDYDDYDYEPSYDENYDYDGDLDNDIEDAEKWLEEEIRQEQKYGDEISDQMPNY